MVAPKIILPTTGNSVAIQLKVYPNPTTKLLTVETGELEEGEVAVELLTVNMEQVLAGFNGKVSAGKHRFDFDVSDLPAGSYIVAVRTPWGTGYQRATIIR